MSGFKRMFYSMLEVAIVLAISCGAYWCAWQFMRWIVSIFNL